MGKVIDVEFRPTDRGRWCVRCDEPFPEGTALCPRCGGELASAARHRAEMQAQARRAVRRVAAAAGGLLMLLVAILVLLVLGVGHAHGDAGADAAARPPAAASAPAAAKAPVAASAPAAAKAPVAASAPAAAKAPVAAKAPGVTKTPAAAKAPGVTKTPAAAKAPVAAKAPAAKAPAAERSRVRARATVAAARPVAEPAPLDDAAEAPGGPRPVRVRLLDGSIVVGTVHAEETEALVIDCSLGLLSIPRARISTIAYDAAAGVGQKRAPVQQLDDDGPAPRRRSARP